MTDLTSLFLYSLPRNILYAFRGLNALWHILAIGATLVIVITGLNWMYFEGTRWFARYLFPAIILGWYVATVFPIVSYIVWSVRKDQRAIYAASSAAQVGRHPTPLWHLPWHQQYGCYIQTAKRCNALLCSTDICENCQ